MISGRGGAIIRKRGEGDRERGRTARDLPSNSVERVGGGGQQGEEAGVWACTVEHRSGLFYIIYLYYTCII